MPFDFKCTPNIEMVISLGMVPPTIFMCEGCFNEYCPRKANTA